MPKKVKKRKKRVSRRAKRGVHNSPKCVAPINYRSGWELKYALYLDANPSVVSYRYEPYAVEYIANYRTGKRRRYFPDFELRMSDGSLVLVEIKPKKKLTLLTNIKKFAAASAMCVLNGMTFRIVTEVDLKALGLLP
jgi:hypothetical protein